jgi:hypothetical protein
MMPEGPWLQGDVAQAVETVAALPTVARASERRESPIRARSHRVDNRRRARVLSRRTQSWCFGKRCAAGLAAEL